MTDNGPIPHEWCGMPYRGRMGVALRRDVTTTSGATPPVMFDLTLFPIYPMPPFSLRFVPRRWWCSGELIPDDQRPR